MLHHEHPPFSARSRGGDTELFTPEGLSAGDSDGPGCLEPGRPPVRHSEVLTGGIAELKGEEGIFTSGLGSGAQTLTTLFKMRYTVDVTFSL